MAFTLVALIEGAIALAWFAVLIWSLVQILKTPAAAWKAAEMNQLVWIAIVIFMPLIGTVLYLTIGRPQLPARNAAATEPPAKAPAAL